MSLISDLTAATDLTSIAAVTKANAVIAAVNATRVNIAAAVADGGTAAAVKAHVSGEDVAAIALLPIPSIDKAVTPASGPSASL